MKPKNWKIDTLSALINSQDCDGLKKSGNDGLPKLNVKKLILKINQYCFSRISLSNILITFFIIFHRVLFGYLERRRTVQEQGSLDHRIGGTTRNAS